MNSALLKSDVIPDSFRRQQLATHSPNRARLYPRTLLAKSWENGGIAHVIVMYRHVVTVVLGVEPVEGVVEHLLVDLQTVQMSV